MYVSSNSFLRLLLRNLITITYPMLVFVQFFSPLLAHIQACSDLERSEDRGSGGRAPRKESWMELRLGDEHDDDDAVERRGHDAAQFEELFLDQLPDEVRADF